MLRKLLMVPFLAVALWSCSKDDPSPINVPQPVPTTIGESFKDGELTISNIWGIPSGAVFDRVEAEITGGDWAVINIVEADFADGVAVLEFPTDINPVDLIKAGRSGAGDYTGYWPAAIDDAEAAVAALGDIFVYNGDVRLGRVYLSDWTGTGSAIDKSFVYFHYADRNFSLSGYNFTVRPGGETSYYYEASFLEGWNVYANIKKNNKKTLCTTSIPNDKKLYWNFESYVY